MTKIQGPKILSETSWPFLNFSMSFITTQVPSKTKIPSLLLLTLPTFITIRFKRLYSKLDIQISNEYYSHKTKYFLASAWRKVHAIRAFREEVVGYIWPFQKQPVASNQPTNHDRCTVHSMVVEPDEKLISWLCSGILSRSLQLIPYSTFMSVFQQSHSIRWKRKQKKVSFSYDRKKKKRFSLTFTVKFA